MPRIARTLLTVFLAVPLLAEKKFTLLFFAAAAEFNIFAGIRSFPLHQKQATCIIVLGKGLVITIACGGSTA